MSKLGQRLIRSAKNAGAYARGEATEGFVRHDIPDVKAIRAEMDLTQQQFAERFGLPLGNVRDWEQGRGVPDAAARALLKVIAAEPEAVVRALAA
jgi:putative transcriptional regulator